MSDTFFAIDYSPATQFLFRLSGLPVRLRTLRLSLEAPDGLTSLLTAAR